MPAARANASASSPSNLAREIRRAERREQSSRMKSALMQFAGRHAADAAGDFVADRDGGDEIAPRDTREFR